MMDAKEMAALAVFALEEKKSQNIRVLDIRHISTIADYFIIAEGTNRNQVQAMADEVEECFAQKQITPKHIEGYSTANWILMDFRDVIIHIFDTENRQFYDLERIWKDGTEIEAKTLKNNDL